MNENGFKFQPSLVIGLGGTGVKALTFVKKALLEINANRMPREVALLAFDTEKDNRFRLGGWGRERRAGSRSTGYVRLGAGEYVFLGGNVRRFAQEVREGKHPHLDWWNVRDYLEQNIPEHVWNLTEGAAQYRQFGRIALFHNLNTFQRMMRSALENIRMATSGSKVHIHIVASVAGGTGSGMFLDVAHLVRLLAPRLGLSEFDVVGYFVLSEGFRGTPQIDMEAEATRKDFHAREIAALRELARLQTASTPEHPYPIVYRPDESELRTEVKKAPFDGLYLLDGRREHNPLNQVSLERGLAPTIAQLVVAQVDRTGGSDIAAHIVNVFRKKDALGLPADVPSIGTFGSYSLVLPIYHWVERWSHRLVLEALDTLLQPAEFSAAKIPVRLASDKAGDRSGAGHDNVEVELRQEREYFTPFLEYLWDVGRRYGAGMRNQIEVLNELNSMTAEDWAEKLDPGIRDPKVARARQDILRLLQADFTRKTWVRKESNPFYINPNLPGSDAEKARQLRGMVERYLTRLLGDVDRDGRHEGGLIRERLQQHVAPQVERFQALITRRLQDILNGNENDPAVQARAGKLGYALAWIDALLEHYQYATAALEGVQTLRRQQGASGSGLLQWLQGYTNQLHVADRDLEDNPSRGNRKAYVRAAQEYLEAHRAAVVREMAKEGATAIVASLMQIKQQLESWKQTLATATAQQGGLYDLVARSARDNEVDLEEMKQIRSQRVLDDEEYEKERYREYTREKTDALDAFLRGLRWEVAFGKQQPHIHLTLALEEETPVRTARHQDAGERNLALFLERARGFFQAAWDELSVTLYLVQKYKDNFAPLAEDLAKANGPLLSLGNEAQQRGQPALFLRLDPKSKEHAEQIEGEPRFTERLLQEMAARMNVSVTVRMDDEEIETLGRSDSQDPYTWTFLHFLDVIPLYEARSWKDELEDYRRFPQNRQFLHIFKAEQEAQELERQAERQLKQPARELDHRVVQILEHKRLFHLAVQAQVYGFAAFPWPGWPGAVGKGILLYQGIPYWVAGNTDNKEAWALVLLPDLQRARREGEQWIDPITGEPLQPDPYLLTPLGDTSLFNAVERFIFQPADVENAQRSFGENDYQRVKETLKYIVDWDLRNRQAHNALGWAPPQWLRGPQRQNALEQAARYATFQFWLKQGVDALRKREENIRSSLKFRDEAFLKQRREADLWTTIVLMVQAEIARLHRQLESFRGAFYADAIRAWDPYTAVANVTPAMFSEHDTQEQERQPQEPSLSPEPAKSSEPSGASEQAPSVASAPSSPAATGTIVCPHCGQEHPADWKFCPVAGKPIPKENICPHCGQQHPPEFRFCPVTGKPL